jgi:Spy/CpxP family protein refolding chaperone
MRQRGPGIERELRQLTQVLTLTEEQQTQVKELLTARRQQMEALRKPSATNDATSETQQPTREQVEAIREATDTKISALLNDEQKAKFAAWQQQRKQMMERHRGQPDSQAPPANPPSA